MSIKENSTLRNVNQIQNIFLQKKTPLSRCPQAKTTPQTTPRTIVRHPNLAGYMLVIRPRGIVPAHSATEIPQ